jgi:hypothetical protein
MTVAWVALAVGAIAVAAIAIACANDVDPTWFTGPGQRLATNRERIAKRITLETAYGWLDEDNAKTVAFLLAESKAQFETIRDGIKNLDTKAGALVTVVTSALGIAVLFGETLRASAWFTVGVGIVVVGLLTAIASLRTAGLPTPDLSVYAFSQTVGVDDNLPRVQFDLIGAWQLDTQRAAQIAGGKARLFVIAAVVIVLGVALLAVPLTLTKPAATAGASTAPAPSGSPR